MSMYTIEEIKKLLKEGKKLLLAGDEKILSQIPAGDWIAGTIPYFMTSKGGQFNQEKIYANILPAAVTNATFKYYDDETIKQVYQDIPERGFSVIIIPGSSSTHLSFALDSPNYPSFAVKPLVGWVSGIDLADLGKVTPKIFDGTQAKPFETGAIVAHMQLEKNKFADIQIINIFKPGDGETITFPEDGFGAKTIIVNEKEINFAEYIAEKNIDTKLPLLADMCGVIIDTGLQKVDMETKEVSFYGPVFKGIEYKFAQPIENYIEEFRTMIPKGVEEKVFFSCNCVLNYLYLELEGKKTEGFTGPMTFGEIAYQLLNQTLVYVTLEDYA